MIEKMTPGRTAFSPPFDPIEYVQNNSNMLTTEVLNLTVEVQNILSTEL